MTIEEKRDLLEDYCCDFKGECEECPLFSNYICRIKCFNTFTDDEIEYAYKVIFGDEKEEVNHPDRYKSGKFECIDVMLEIFGVEAVKTGAIKNFFVMAGCDGRAKSRNYYTEFAEKLPKDAVILTAGCAKYKHNKLNLGDINGIPRVLDAGQCNDSYSLVVIALKLAEALL